MKKIVISFIFIFYLFNNFTVYSQLKVESSGMITTGNSYSNGGYMEINRYSYPHLTFIQNGVRMGRLQSNEGNLGYSTPDGTYYWVNFHPYDDEAIFNLCGFFYQGLYDYSDEKLKRNIKPIDGALKKILKLQGIVYQDLTPNKDSAEYIKKKDYDKEYLGMVAQNVEAIVPEVVKDNSSGLKAIAYHRLVPLVIEAMKEQQAMINSLKDEIKKLKNEKKESNLKSIQVNELNSSSEQSANEAVLYQNNPNPFNESTTIHYLVPNASGSAMLYIFTMQGNLYKSIPLYDKGNSSIKINGGELQAGMYIYTLVVDGKEIDSKRMILTK